MFIKSLFISWERIRLEKSSTDVAKSVGTKFTDKDVSLLDQQCSTAELFQQLCKEESEIVQQIQSKQNAVQQDSEESPQQVLDDLTARLKTASEQLKHEVNISDQQNAGANLKEFVQQSKELQGRISSDAKNIQSFQERIAVMDTQIQSLPGASELNDNELATQLKSLQIRRKVISEGIETMKQGDVSSSDIDHLQNELDHIDNELEEVNAAIVASAEQSGNETRESLTKKREQLQAQVDTLEEESAQHREALKKLQKVIGWLSSTRRQSMRPGADLQSLGTATSPDLPEAFEETSKLFLERSTFLKNNGEQAGSIQSLSARRREILLRRMALVEKLFACCSEAYTTLPEISESDLSINSIFRAGEREKSWQETQQALQRTIEEQKEQASLLEEAKAEQKEAMDGLQQQLNEQDHQEELQQLKEQLQQAQEELDASQQKVETLESTLATKQSTLSELEQKLDDNYVSSLEAELVQRESELAKLTELHRKVEEEQDLERHDVAASRQQFSELQKELKAKDQVILALRELNKTTPGSPVPPEEARHMIAKLKAANVAHQTQNAHLMQEVCCSRRSALGRTSSTHSSPSSLIVFALTTKPKWKAENKRSKTFSLSWTQFETNSVIFDTNHFPRYTSHSLRGTCVATDLESWVEWNSR